MTGDAPALRVKGICKRYDSFSLGPLSLEVAPGEIVGLVGRNGAGKTTLMRLIFGVVHADAGKVELFGQDISELSEAELVLLRQRIGLISDVVAYPPEMSVAEVEQLYELFYPAFSREHFENLCRELDVELGSRKVKELSRGTGMKLQLAAELSCGAELLVMDEPTAGLDPIVRDEVLDVVRSWMETGERSVLISSHITSDLEHLADRIVLIDEGRIVLESTTDELAAMGVARLRQDELERVLADGTLAADSARIIQRDLSCELLVPDRVAFTRAYPSYVCERASIDEILLFMVKGEAR